MRAEKILSHHDVDEKTGCHIWRGYKRTRNGIYGQVKYGGITRRAHRVVWELINGPILNGLQILHSCDVGICVNPDHLRLGTQLENEKDKVSRDRQWRKLTKDSVLKIRNDPRSTRAIGKDFNVSSMTVSDIKRRKYWSHI